MSDSSNSLHRVLTALAILGEATPKAIATHAELGYSTVSPKLRSLGGDGMAVSQPDASGKTVWKLTPKGVLATAVTAEQADTIEPPTEQVTTVDVVAGGESGDDSEPDGADPAPDADASTELRIEEPDGRAAVVAEPQDAAQAEAGGTVVAETASVAGDTARSKPRRRGGSLKNAALKVLQDSPDEQFRVGQVCKAINAGNTDPTASKASPGAVSNALVSWLNDGVIQRTVEKPATYQAR